MGRCAKRQGSAAIPLLEINIRPPQSLNGSRSGVLILSALDSRRSERDMVRLRNHREIGIGEFAIVVDWVASWYFREHERYNLYCAVAFAASALRRLIWFRKHRLDDPIKPR